jgi:hypothetical protein
MTDIFTPEYAAHHCGEVLWSSPHAQERLMAARVLGRYDAGDQIIHMALLKGLSDPEGCVRVEVFRGLGRMKADKQELPVLARGIRKRLELEQEGSPAWWAGVKALDSLSRLCCPG